MRTFVKRIYKFCRSALKKLYLHIKKQEIQKKLFLFSCPYKLHLGCGRTRLEGWINIDRVMLTGTVDIVWDLNQGIPVKDSSCELLYCEHLLEHMAVTEGVSFLRECRRVLQPGGILRIAMPSLDVLIETSYLGNWREWWTLPEYQFVQTRAEMLNISFYWWGHKWLYDREELHRRLREAGFVSIKDVEWGYSDVLELRNRETRAESLLICEAQK